ncbi:uncharacterized protein [Oryza sativa Japonica Group]|uniref:uncharacterized protein n=1 Tax=Oryza sativa subsp. japonica TaxID=39947 RepID=UPI00339CAA64
MRKIMCLCADCKNEIAWKDAPTVKEHLVTRGFMDKYKIWTRHGEEQVNGAENVVRTQVEDMVHDDGSVEDNIDLKEMLHHADPEELMGLARGLNNFEALQKAAKEVLYDESKGCDNECPTCGASRYKSNSNTGLEPSDTTKGTQRKISQLVMWYLPVKDRIKRIYSNPRDAELMCWHEERRKKDGMIQHPVDSRQWINFDAQYREFAKDPQNIRFALSTDGVNPFGDMSSSNNMANLWKEGLKVWDEYIREYFTVKAIIFLTINDYPAMFSVSGQIKDKTRCVICLNGTYYRYLSSSNKLVYMQHRRFLRTNHKYRKMKTEFDGTEETDPAPKPTSGEKVYAMTEKIVCEFGKVTKKPSKGTQRKKPEKTKKPEDSTNQDVSTKPDDKLPPPFKKHSIFFKYLPYWNDLEVRHAIDIMHLEKNVFDNIVGTLLDMPKKTKDGLQSWMDLVEMGIREELHHQK